MKRYQAITLCSAISIGSFALGMACVKPVQIVEGPFDANSKIFVQYEVPTISAEENELLDEVLIDYNDYNEDKARFQQEEIELRDSNIIDTIKLANKMILENDKRMIHIDCQLYISKIDDRFEVNPDMIGFDPNTKKVATVIDICKMVGVEL